MVQDVTEEALPSYGALVEEWRGRRRMTKKDLADAARLSAGYISHIISGNRTPSPSAIAALAGALELDEDEQRRFWRAAGYSSPVEALMTSRQNQPLQQLDDMAARSFAMQDSGFVLAHPELPLKLLKQWILEEATELIQIQDTWIADPLLLVLNDKAIHAEITRKGVRIQVLLLKEDPSFFAQQRACDIYPYMKPSDAERLAVERIQRNIRDVRRLYRSGITSLEVKQYAALPYFQLFACGDRALIGYYSLDKRGSTNPQIEIKGKDTFLGKFAQEQFNELWERTKESVILEEPDIYPSE